MSKTTHTILIVEDDPDSRLAICTIVESLGFKQINFGSGAEALQGIKGQNLSLALLDIMMPNMNGYELLEELKKIIELEHMPVIMVTAKDQDDDILKGYQVGADYYITKPFTSKQLEYGIKLFIGGE